MSGHEGAPVVIACSGYYLRPTIQILRSVERHIKKWFREYAFRTVLQLIPMSVCLKRKVIPEGPYAVDTIAAWGRQRFSGCAGKKLTLISLGGKP